ncbi:hypothetical protein Q7P37_006743 [Cladosporium fusiforme]
MGDPFPVDDTDYDLLPTGWTIRGQTGARLGQYGVVTQSADYVPFQSVFQPDGRHAYNPADRDRFPTTGTASEGLTQTERRRRWSAHRPVLRGERGQSFDLEFRRDSRANYNQQFGTSGGAAYAQRDAVYAQRDEAYAPRDTSRFGQRGQPRLSIEEILGSAEENMRETVREMEARGRGGLGSMQGELWIAAQRDLDGYGYDGQREAKRET